MTKSTNIKGTLAAGVCAGVLAMTGGLAHAQETAKVGFITELTGPWSFFGTSCKAGLDFALPNINPPGKTPIEFLITDNQTNPAQSVAAARSLDAQDGVMAISGPTSSDNALAIYGYAEQNKVPFVVPVAAFPQLTKPGTEYTFRVEPNAAGWGYAIAKFIEERTPGAKVALLYSDFALMRAIAAGLKYQAPKAGIDVSLEIVFPQGTNDATVQAAQVAAAQPDWVVSVGAGGFDNTLTNQLLDLGISADKIIHPFGITTQVLGWGARSKGSYYGTFFDANLDDLTPEGQKFVEDFRAQNNRPPAYVENFCYVTAQIIREALDAAGSTDREAFVKAVSELQTKEATSGIPIAFDENGARKEYMYFMQIGDVTENDYTAQQEFYIEWDPEVIPVYDLVK